MSGWIVTLLLPLADNAGRPFPPDDHRRVRRELTERFGGLTAFTRAPAEGLWKESGETVAKDDIVVFEIMADDLDEPWWRDYRRRLEARFRQDAIVIRAQAIRLL